MSALNDARKLELVEYYAGLFPDCHGWAYDQAVEERMALEAELANIKEARMSWKNNNLLYRAEKAEAELARLREFDGFVTLEELRNIQADNAALRAAGDELAELLRDTGNPEDDRPTVEAAIDAIARWNQARAALAKEAT